MVPTPTAHLKALPPALDIDKSSRWEEPTIGKQITALIDITKAKEGANRCPGEERPLPLTMNHLSKAVVNNSPTRHSSTGHQDKDINNINNSNSTITIE